MAKTTLNTVVQKYEMGTEVRTLTNKNIKDGIAFKNSKGIVKAFNDKTGIYTVSINLVGGGTVDVEYKDSEIILKDLDVETTNEMILQTRKEVERITKINKLITFVGCGLALLLLVAAIIIMFTVKNQTIMLWLYIVLLALVIGDGAGMLVLTSNNTKKIVKNNRKIESIALASSEKDKTE